MGMAVGDNYTPEVVDAVATVARRLESMHDASAVVLVGHSGGGTIAANVLGRHPDVADAALLVGCGCDPEAWRARMRAQQPNSIWDERTASLMPLSLVGGVARGHASSATGRRGTTMSRCRKIATATPKRSKHGESTFALRSRRGSATISS